MKILKRNFGHRNTLLFMIFSLVYLQSVYSLSIGKSLFSKEAIGLFFQLNYVIFFIFLLASLMVLMVKRYSEQVLLVYLTMIVGKSFILLSGSFNKLTLVLNFIYLMFAFYFYVTWELEVEMACFNPRFSQKDLEKEARFNLKGFLKSINPNLEIEEIRITNIDEKSCFLLMPEHSTHKFTANQMYELESTFEGVTFQNTGKIVSVLDRGIGLVFVDFKDNRVSWSELYKVCLERGIMS